MNVGNTTIAPSVDVPTWCYHRAMPEIHIILHTQVMHTDTSKEKYCGTVILGAKFCAVLGLFQFKVEFN